jgi:hypothetical protein
MHLVCPQRGVVLGRRGLLLIRKEEFSAAEAKLLESYNLLERARREQILAESAYGPLGAASRLARLYIAMKRPNEAAKWKAKFDEELKSSERAIELRPKSMQPALRATRAEQWLQFGIVSEAVGEADKLISDSSWPADQLYNFSCIFAVASAETPGGKREYADRAVDLLTKAVKAGFTDVVHIRRDTDLDSLRGREDFKKLVADLEGSQGKGAK